MDYLAYWVISLLFVIALILGLALLIKKFVLPQAGTTPLFKKSSKRRLELVETLMLDHKSKLLLIRRDNVEHLLLQGPNDQSVIETGIKRIGDQNQTLSPDPLVENEERPDSDE